MIFECETRAKHGISQGQIDWLWHRTSSIRPYVGRLGLFWGSLGKFRIVRKTLVRAFKYHSCLVGRHLATSPDLYYGEVCVVWSRLVNDGPGI